MRQCSVSQNGMAILDFGETKSPIMQFTGLTDKLGKEIYEGDIVKTEEYPLIKWTISYDEDRWEEGHYHYAGFTFPEGIENIEVIGNIYNNSELLTT